ncbi:hypothetical protein PTE31013_01400 [Pandoraea terrigena]|uniref:Uncharacterized protein n=1 Tax=Pandoraea terrigena TaxID=2508292 RepID=A0A5E4TEV2_9BURK|nr:hypothetical protein PTE31013_01400 [Pandoraea terrigena]
MPCVPSQPDGRAKRKSGSWTKHGRNQRWGGKAVLGHGLQLCNKCNKVALLHEMIRGAEARRHEWRVAPWDTSRYISAQQILVNRRNMSSSAIDWHAVRFIPGIGNLQGIDETMACCGAGGPGGNPPAGHGAGATDMPRSPRRFARSDIRPSSTFRLRRPASGHDDRTAFATSRSRGVSTGKHPITRPRLRVRRRRRATHFFSANHCARCAERRSKTLFDR